ncbi:MAG TPA: four helix bundle protein [Segetibacter sp.]|nr:four helix bundle protein [Segetibacter sp.]
MQRVTELLFVAPFELVRMTAIYSYRDLIVWQKSMLLVTDIYAASNSFPTQEMYGLTNQLRRSAVSIPSNIAEGYGRHSTGDYKRFLQIAVGSLFELQTQVEIAFNLKYLAKDKFDTILGNTKELDRMLLSLIKKI